MRILFVNQFYHPDVAATAKQVADTGRGEGSVPRADRHMEPAQNTA